MSLTKIDNQATSVVNGDETLTDTSKMEMNKQTQEAPITVESAPDARPNYFDEVYGVPCRIGAFVAQTSDTSGLLVARLNWTTVATCNPVARLFADYRFARFDIDVTLSFTGNPMASGTYLAAVMPEYNQIPNTCNVLGNNFTPTSWLRKLVPLPHTLIQMNRNMAFRWRIPFLYFQEYLSWNDRQTAAPWASLIIVCLHPYVTQTGGPSSVSGDLYMSLANITAFEPTPLTIQGSDDAVNKPRNTSGDAYSRGQESSKPRANNSAGSFRSRAPDLGKPWYSRAADVAQGLLGVTPYGAALGAARYVFGFDSPARTVQPEAQVVYDTQKLNYTRGHWDVDRHACDPSAMVTFDSKTMNMLSITGDEMNLGFFQERWQYLGTTTFNGSTANGTLLDSVPITPILNEGGTISSRPASFADFAAFSTFWRGSMHYRLVFPTNCFKFAKILVAVSYDQNVQTIGNIQTGNVDPRSMWHVIYDISNEDGELDIHVPFKSKYPVLRTMQDQAIVPTTTYGVPQGETELGTLGIWLISAVTVPTTVSATCYFSLYQAWGSDMEFYQYKPGVGYFAQGLDIEVTTSAQTFLNTMSKITTLLDLLRRPVKIGSCYFSAAASDVIAPYIFQITPNSLSTNAAWSYALSSYAGRAGSFRLVVRRIYGGSNPMTFRITSWNQVMNWISQGGYTPGTQSDWTSWADMQAGTALQAYNTFTSANQWQSRFPQNSNAIHTIAPGVGTSAVNSIPDSFVTTMTANKNEVVIELPNLLPYRTGPTWLWAPNQSFSTYKPANDFTVPMVAIAPDFNISSVGETPSGVELYLAPADDFRLFWFNGGPTTSVPLQYTFGATAGTETTYHPAYF